MKRTIIEGSVTYEPSVDYSEVTEITRWLSCHEANMKAAFPNLTTIGGDLDYREADTGDSFPSLETIGGTLFCGRADTKAAFPKLTTVGGLFYCSGADMKAAFPKLTTVGGLFYCSGADTKAAFPKLTTIGGYLDCEGSDMKAAFPKLTTIGEYLNYHDADTEGAFPKLKQENIGTERAKQRVFDAFKLQGFLFADHILAKLVKTKETNSGAKIHTVVIAGESKQSYCIEQSGVFSHGNTIKQARESLLYKIGNRDKSSYKNWTMDTKITKKQAIESYRVITGACESGVRRFVESSGLENRRKFTVGEVIKITEGQYRNDSYREFFGK